MPQNSTKPPLPLTRVKEKVDVSTVALILISAFCVGALLGLSALTISWNYLQGGGLFRMATVGEEGEGNYTADTNKGPECPEDSEAYCNLDDGCCKERDVQGNINSGSYSCCKYNSAARSYCGVKKTCSGTLDNGYSP